MTLRAAKSGAKRALIGLCRGLERRPHRDRDAIVTLLHEVGGTASDYSIAAPVFKAQLNYLLEQEVTWYRASELARDLGRIDSSSGVCITFDDGTLSGYDAALELLEAGASCTHFIIPGRVNRNDKNTMSWSQIQKMSAAGVEIGSHSMTHPNLTSLDDSELAQELENSKLQIEDQIGQAVTSFAYPYGYYSRRVIEAVASSGYDCAFTTRHLYASPASDVFQIPRFEPLESSERLVELFRGEGHWFYRWLGKYYRLRDTLKS